jgi:hypothetical protein
LKWRIPVETPATRCAEHALLLTLALLRDWNELQ